MAALDSDSDEDLVSYGTGLELLEEGASQIGLSGLWKTGRGSRIRGENAQPCAGPWLAPGKDLLVTGARNSDKGGVRRAFGALKLSVGFELLRKMGWKEGQGIGPRVKRKPRQQKPDPGVKIYGCALPPGGSEGSEDEDNDYLPENVTFAPKDVMPVDFTPKDNVHGLAYKGLDPHQALFGTSEEPFNLFCGGPAGTSNLLGDIGVNKGRKLGISGQAFGVGALEEEDDDIYATETLSKYDTILKDEEPGDGLYGWTAPKQYQSQKETEKALRYVGKILDGFSLASKPLSSKKIYPPPELPRDYRPVHYFRPVIAATSENSHLLQVLSESAGKPVQDSGTHSRHQLNASKRGELLGETPIQGMCNGEDNDVNDKQSAVKMKMFGKLTRDTFEWHPDKLLCKRFNVPDPYPDSTLVGLPRVKRDKYSVFNFLALPETASLPTTQESSAKVPQLQGPDKSRKPSRWDASKQEKKEDSISEFLSLARSKVGPPQQESSPLVNKEGDQVKESLSDKLVNKGEDSQAEGEGSRPSMDLFKAIFASSSEEKSSSSEDEQGDSEDDQEGTGEADFKSPQEADLVETPAAHTNELAPQEPVTSFLIPKMQIDEREEFGPQLPPVFCPNARQKLEAPQKEKHKKNKEKHKTKKEHKRRKEKKKKHRKHKHKGKQKNKKSEKSSSSESTDSSDSQSDEEGTADMSPQELLRRLKSLPLRRQ
ncbi:PREDICTED: G patch domain-containing protein 1 [Hipposideros armiger]|uniref:G patch domain-containing protein 1 n=1 Tax=Hipposideros armiger TaxID=186990 RepID=A0A8B7SDU4_HIPAR|nr:PREDICTED: G patch domain-containing protein 1 [Hipposideros armiger]